MPEDNFDYNRSVRFVRIAIKKITSVIITTCSKTCNAANVNEIRSALEELSCEYEEFKRIVKRGFMELDEPDEDKLAEAEAVITEERDTVTAAVLSVRAKANTFISQFEGNRNRDSLNNSFLNTSGTDTGVKLPKINIPTFDGTKEKFLDFSAIFENTVHDEPTISKVKKLCYLKNSLTGEAYDQVKDIALSDAGYDEAWSLIQSKYRDIKSIVRVHFDTLFATTRIKSVKEVPTLLSSVDKALKGLEACGEQTKQWSSIISYIVSERLDEATFNEFEKSLLTNSSFPSWDSLRAYMESIASISQRKTDQRSSTPGTSTPNRSKAAPSSSNAKRNASFVTTASPEKSGKPSCPVCNVPHLLIECADFKAKSPKERFNALKGRPVCRNCFNSHHKVADCKKQPNCRFCELPHHSMLHFDEGKATSNNPTASMSSDAATTGVTCISPVSTMLSGQKSTVLLPTAVVKYVCGDTSGEMRVLLDSCSQLNLISRSFVNRMRIPTTTREFTQKVSGVNGANSCCNQVVSLVIESQTESFKFVTLFNVIETPLPYSVRNLQLGSLSMDLSKYQLADPSYYWSTTSITEIDALLGIEAYNRCVRGNVMNIGSLCLRDTTLGWTISSSGVPSVEPIHPSANKSSTLYCGLTTEAIDQRLQRFWETESIPDTLKSSTDAIECDKHFLRTYRRDLDGKFVLRLPFKRDPTCILNNFDQALAYSKRVERRLAEPVSTMYDAFMQEYLDLGHMSRVEDPDYSKRHFIPHHAVLNPSSTTTKLRVVFNASYKTRSNLSLNDTLMVGENLQPEVFDTLLQFRRYRYSVSADIEKFYRCIWVQNHDRAFLSVIWKNQIYELNTVTYGTGPAAYQSSKCLMMLAQQVEETHPPLAYIIRKCRYMDDTMFGADTVEEIVEIRELLHNLLASAGFHLRKYQSNSSELLATVDPHLVETKLTKTIGGDDSLSVLGLSWVPTLDVFRLRTDIKLEANRAVSKRLILSTISKLFDPLGCASPVIIRGKLMFQRLWKLGVQWDSPLDEAITNEFHSYLADLNAVHRVPYPRFVGKSVNDRIVGFSDASEHAYCAAVYIVTVEDGVRRSSLYCSKTRVAPVKSLTVPQLELQAATLLAELVSRVRNIVTVADDHVHLFTDATIVLSWLARPANEWKVFVRNRVAKIVLHYPSEYWSHVSGKLNPADLATRGLTTEQLSNSPLWHFGPEFIVQDEICKSECLPDEHYNAYLSKPKAIGFIAIKDSRDARIIETYSSYWKLVRVYATVRAVVRKWRTSTSPRSRVTVTTDDLRLAERDLVYVVQQELFSNEIHRLHENRKLGKRSRLRQHNPFVDEFGILRSRTRLQLAKSSYDRRNPVILPANCHFATIFVRHVHERYYHATRQFLMAYLSVQYLFIGGIARVVKSVIRQCLICCRHFRQTTPQLMGDLPVERVTPRSPFEVVGVDFTGAFTVKCNYHRARKYAKAYAAIFICFSTRAVHIELVPTLSTEDFLNALKCFIARRGLPTTVFSDNGTNFKGAENYLHLADADIDTYATTHRIKWKFNPPYTPHRGGIWEAAVKSAKRFLPIVTKGQTLTYNELRVLLTEIEAILNSRPLSYRVTNDPSNEVLTPGHFLIGRNLVVVPAPSEDVKSKINLSAQYRANQQRIKDFWRIWSVDYVNQLRCRSKWFDKQPNIVEGQLVFYRRPNYPVLEWPIARVDRCLPDSNGIVRTVELRVQGALRVVPITQLTPLPIDGNAESSA